MARRGENIRKRKDGRWEGRFTVYDIEKGQPYVRSVYGRSYGEAKEKLSQAKRSVELLLEGFMGTAMSGPVFHMAAQGWLEEVKQTKKYSTYRKYRTVYEKHLRERLGGVPLSELDEQTMDSVFARDGEQMLSTSLTSSILSVLNRILDYASVRYHAGPETYTYRKRHLDRRPLEILNHTQQAKLIRRLYDRMDIYKLGILLCISTGLRLGEICALKWEDIDLEGGLLHVNATVQRIAIDDASTKTTLLEGAPKSVFSKREIPLSDEVMKLLCPYYGKGIYVLKGSCPMEPRTYQNRFQRYLEEAGIERKNFHILRHSFATNCVEGGADIKSLSEILGHSDVKITLNRYVHPDLEMKRQHLNAISAVYGQYLSAGAGR